MTIDEGLVLAVLYDGKMERWFVTCIHMASLDHYHMDLCNIDMSTVGHIISYDMSRAHIPLGSETIFLLCEKCC